MRRFPALYRMPVVYLAACVASVVTMTGRRSEVDFGGQPSPAEVLPSAVSVTVSRAMPADPILRTAGLVRRKVLVCGRDVLPRETPGGEPSGPRIERLATRYVIDETPSHWKLGRASGEADGWVDREGLLPWESRLVARPTGRIGRPAIEVYADRACLASTLAGTVCPRHAEACPRERENEGSPGEIPRAGWPILRASSVSGADSEARVVYEVGLLDREDTPSLAERLAPLRASLRHVYIAFVIDTTASMKSSIDAARALAKGLADDFGREAGGPILHLGLVEYRDDAPGLGFRARVATPFTDPPGFRAVVDTLEPALREDESGSESVFDGVAMALDAGAGGLGWPSGRVGVLATRMVVVLGDAPDHAPDLIRAGALAAQARAAGIMIVPVALRPTGSASDAARWEAQSKALADGSYRPKGGPAAGLVRVGEITTLARRLRTLVDDRADHARWLSDLSAAEDEGRLAEFVAGRGLTMVQVAPFLDDLRRGGPAPLRTRREVPAFRRGWLAARAGDVPLVTVEVALTREELGRLADEAAHASSGFNDPGSIWLPAVVAAILGELAFLDADRSALAPADWLRRRDSLPVPLPSGTPTRERLAAIRDDLASHATRPYTTHAASITNLMEGVPLGVVSP